MRETIRRVTMNEATAGGAVGQATQVPASAAPARRPGPPPVVSPEVHADRRVTFRLRAPNAEAVAVSGEWGGREQAMAQDAEGVWSVTIDPLEPDLYGYGCAVDGFRTLDPSNSAVKPSRSPT